MQPKLGIIAGGGLLPKKVIDSCQLSGRAYHVIAIDGHALSEALVGTPHSWVSISRAGSGFDILEKEGITEVVMIGDVKVPSFFNEWPDYRTLKFFSKSALKSLFSFNGDNSSLLAFATELEKEGIKVIGAHEILSNLLAQEGLLGAVTVPNELLTDIKIGISAAFDLGKRDVGQAVIVKAGKIIIEEGSAGTAQMIKDSQNIIPDGRGGVLIKLKKPNQDRRMDLPTIGVLTVLEAYEAGLSLIHI